MILPPSTTFTRLKFLWPWLAKLPVKSKRVQDEGVRVLRCIVLLANCVLHDLDDDGDARVSVCLCIWGNGGSQVAVVRNQIAQIIEQRQAAIKAGRAEARTLLDIMLQPSNEEDTLTPEEITNHVMTFLIAGHETTSNALCWAWYLLSQYPDVQCKLRDEVVRLRAHLLACSRVRSETCVAVVLASCTRCQTRPT